MSSGGGNSLAAAAKAAGETAAKKPAPPVNKIYLVDYPKIVFMYPTWLLAGLCGIYMAIAGDANPERADTFAVSAVFLSVFAANIMVFSFDFPRTTSLTLAFGVIASVLGLVLLTTYQPTLVPVLTTLLTSFHPRANATFYFAIFSILSIVFLLVWIHAQFDYWEVTPNELLHHHGVLSDLERMSSPSLKLDKEIKDLFEYLLLRSGRMVLHPSNEPRAIVLENVLFIDRKERAITKMLGALQVQIRPASQSGDES